MSQTSGRKCVRCGEALMGKFLELDSSTFLHSQCFVCVECHREIGSSPFVDRPQGYVCGDCNDRIHKKQQEEQREERVKRVCDKCNDEIEGKYFELREGVYFHPTCFKCHQCDGLIGSNPFLTEPEGFLCSSCHEKRNQHKRDEHTQHSHHQKGHECVKCGLEIESKEVEHDSQWYHTECFRCVVCHGSAGDHYKEKDRQIYCQECFEKGFAESCERCGGVLADSYVVALRRKYHPKCLLCFACDVPLENTSFYDSNDRPHCRSCAEKNLNSSSSSPQHSSLSVQSSRGEKHKHKEHQGDSSSSD